MDNTLNFIREKTRGFEPEIAVILGSGLGDYTKGLDGIEIPYGEIEGFMPSIVKGHKGSLFFGVIKNKKVVIMQGRFHFYEGYPMKSITFPVRVFKKLGVKDIIITNAAGALDLYHHPGELMLISDHINLTGTNPLIGKNDDDEGERFPDMSEVYSMQLRKIALEAARELNIDIKEGVYAATTGPSYETPAEVNMLKLMGADVVGMSTVPEAIVANWLKMRVLGISLISNYASGVFKNKLNHLEVIEAGKNASDKIKALLDLIIEKI